MTEQQLSALLEKPLPVLERELAQVDPVFWTLQHRLTDKGEPFEFEDRRYLLQITEDLSPKIVIQKAAQVGATELAISRALWFADTRTAKVIYTFPTANDVADFSNSRLNLAIQRSPYLRSRIHEVDNVTLKQLGDSFIFFRGSWTERQAIAIPSDFNIHDELDFSKPDIQALYKARLDASRYAWELAISTPTLPEWGINALFEQSDQHHWLVKCEGCHEWFTLCCGYPDAICQKEETSYYVCPFCRKPFDRRTCEAHWVAKYPGRSLRGYHISQTLAPWISADTLLSKQVTQRYTKTFYNFNLGLPYAASDMPLTRPLLLSCVDEHSAMEATGSHCTMGIDQGDVLWAVVSRPEGSRRRIVYLERIEREDGFRRVAQLMHQFDVDRCVIDALPNKHSARQLARAFPGRVYLAYYSDVQKDDVCWDELTAKVTVNRTESLDRAADRLIKRELILPRLDESVHLFIEHLCNLAKDRREDQHGQLQEVWVHIGDDHFAHANNYDEVAQSKTVRVFVPLFTDFE